jgi:hypothetical protein
MIESMNLRLVVAVIAAIAPLSFAQTADLRVEPPAPEDPALRAEAVRLNERALKLSSPVWPANEAYDTFRVFDAAPGEPSEGDFKISVSAPALRRWEFNYGAYHFIQVQNGREFATFRTRPDEPAAVTVARKLLPVNLGRFDQSDIIRRIGDATIDGRRARCVDFDTVQGEQRQSGQMCVDAQSGWLLLLRQGDTTIRQSAFFAFNNGFLPGHVERWVNGQKQIEIEQKTVVRTDYPEDYFTYPENAAVRQMCNGFEPAYSDRTPQPPTRPGSVEVIDVRVHGRIGTDGKPYQLQVLDPVRPALAAEALRLVSTWTYHPAMCEYKPTTTETDFIVHFKGW